MFTIIANFLLQIGAPMFFIGGFILMPIVWIITVPYYDKVLGLNKIYNPLFDVFGVIKGSFKAVWYGGLVVLHKGMKKSIELRVYGDLDFNHCARLIDKIICYPFFVLFFGGTAIVLISAVFFGLAKLTSL